MAEPGVSIKHDNSTGALVFISLLGEGEKQKEKNASSHSIYTSQSAFAVDLAVKVPQIIKIWRGKSGQGISLTAVSLEIFAVTASLAYGFASGFPLS